MTVTPNLIFSSNAVEGALVLNLNILGLFTIYCLFTFFIFSLFFNHMGGGQVEPCDAKFVKSACFITIISLL